MKTYLQVPFGEHLTVKRMGARFDVSRKAWFVPDGLDLVPFIPWVPGLAQQVDKKVARVTQLRTGKNQGEFKE